MSANRVSRPTDHAEAAAQLRAQLQTRYTALDEADYAALAKLVYDERDCKLHSDVHESVYAHFAAIDLDARYPDLWPEFRALRRKPILLLHAENSDMLNDATVARMRKAHDDLVVDEVPDQGHAPLLHLGDWPQRIARFLAEGR